MKHIHNILNMYAALFAVLLQYVSKWTGFAAFEATENKFDLLYTKLNEYIEVQKQILKGYTAEKKAKRKALAEFALLMSKKIKAWATDVGNIGLAGEMNIPISKLLYGRANIALAYANQIKDALVFMTDAQKAAYGITDALILDYQAAIDAFEAALSLPRNKIVERQNAGKKIREYIKKGNLLLKNELDGLMEQFRISDPDFYTEYFDARKIVDLMRHTAIEGNVTDPVGEDLKKVKVTFKGKDKVTGEEKLVYEEMTSKDGNFIKRELDPELEWDVTFELPTYVPKTVSDIELTAGEHEKLEIKLEKIA